DGVTVSERRDSGTACDYLLGGTASVTQRLNEVLNYFSPLGTACADPTVGLDVPEQRETLTPRTQLYDLTPNPLSGGQRGSIRFTMAQDGSAKVEVFNLEGRI